VSIFPKLTDPVIAIDIEVKEEKELKKFGPGSHRHYLEGEDSYILGVAISDSANDYYFPASKELFDWLKSEKNNRTFIGHNILYDLSWLSYEGFTPEKIADTMGLVRLLSEDRMSYSLDACASAFLGIHKNEDEIKAFCEEHKLRGKPQKWLWKMPFELVERYAKIDTRITYDLYHKLIPEISKQKLNDVWEVECELLPILAQTHHKGIRIDDTRRHQASEELDVEIKALEALLWDKAGCEFNTGSGKQKQEVFDRLGLPYTRTDKGNPSFRAEEMLPFGVEPDMEYLPHVLVVHNKLEKLKRDFVDRLEDFMVLGRIHPMINPYGTKTGRPTSNTPNIFQIPKRGRGKEICRTLFIPEEGEKWASMDYASEEYRVFAHYAVGRGSDRYRHMYNTVPDYDMHTENAQLAGVTRAKAKTIGLGVLFGMGAEKMAVSLGEGREKGLRVVQKFHSVNPSFKATSKLVENRAVSRGYIHTLLGRRRRLDRKSAYRGLNFLTQGNSADLAKLTIVLAKKEGLLEKVNFLLWLYDEYNLSASEENMKYVQRFKELGEHAIKFRVPMYLDMGVGDSWGEVK
jgi:DNA polymerase-1